MHLFGFVLLGTLGFSILMFFLFLAATAICVPALRKKSYKEELEDKKKKKRR